RVFFICDFHHELGRILDYVIVGQYITLVINYRAGPCAFLRENGSIPGLTVACVRYIDDPRTDRPVNIYIILLVSCDRGVGNGRGFEARLAIFREMLSEGDYNACQKRRE